VCRLVASVGVLVASLSLGGTYDSSEVSVHVFFFFDLVYVVTLLSRSNLIGLTTFWVGVLGALLQVFPLPSPSDDLKLPSSCRLCGVAVG